jgi:methyltransferase (TIGR00027 family)
VEQGTASHTARSVAARRLQYDRVGTPYGDPWADQALTRDVADGLTPAHNRMHEYIRARTAFFDRAVVSAIERGITQVVIGGAGYDGRAFRYASPGVRWFEVDHPATQADKRERITRLGLPAAHIAFIPADFTVDQVAEPLLAAGLDPGRIALFLFEGVAVYLDRPVIERVLAAFRAATPAGSTLAISVSVGGATSETRAKFQRRVAEIGEPARTVLAFDDAAGLMSAVGWQLRETSDRQRSAGLLLARADTPVAAPATAPAAPAAPAGPGGPRRAPDGTAAAPAAVAGQAPRPATTPGSESGIRLAAGLPLSALLSQALVAFTIEADNETEHRLPHRTQDHGLAPGSSPGAPWLTSLTMYANCLRHLPDEGITVAELAGRARTGTNLDGMRRWRYVTFTPAPEPGQPKRPRPDAMIAPTAWGIEARETWQAVTGEVESRWRDRLGPEEFAALRAALSGVVENLDQDLPDCLPVLGYGLRTRREPRDGATAGRVPTPPHAAAPLAAAAPVADLPLWALLSRTLTAFARQYEAEPGPSLAVSADIVRVLTADGVHTKDIPALGGVSREAVSMAMGLLRKYGVVTEGPDPAGSRFKVTRLTARGVMLRDEYPALAADIERDWRTRFGDGTVTALRLALEPLTLGDPPPLYAGLTPYPDNWRARLPRPATLPHYPMTLHRGGYPDGS